MAKIKCEYCETEYESDMPACPLCGTPTPNYSAGEEQYDEAPPKRKRGAREAPREDAIPRWIAVLISVFLGLAVIVGAVYAMYALDIIKIGKKAGTKVPDSLDLPIEAPEDEPASDDTSPSESEGPEPSGEPEETVCTGLSVTPASVRIGEIGISAELTALVEPAGCTEPVTWVSSNPAVCSVDAAGKLTSFSEGTAIITVACGSETSTVEVLCDFSGEGGVSEGGVTLSVEDLTLLDPGEQTAIQIKNAPEDAEIVWSSKDESVCIVKDGTVTAISRGETEVVAAVDGKELSCKIRCRFDGTYTPDPDTSGNSSGNRLDHDDVTIGVGDTFEISVVNGRSGGWNVTDSSVISINANGIVTGISAGTAEVFTVVGGERLSCLVRVK